MSCTELQEFVDTANMSPAVLELFSKLLQTILSAAKEKPHIAHAFSMTQPEKNRERLQKLLKSAGCLVVPVFRKAKSAWAACTVTAEKVAGKIETRCIVSCSSEFTGDEKTQLEARLDKMLLTRNITYRCYLVDAPRSHVVVLFEICATHLQVTHEETEKIRENFMLCAHDAHETLVAFTMRLLQTTCERHIQDVTAAVAEDPELTSQVANMFEWPSLFDLSLGTLEPQSLTRKVPAVAAPTAAPETPVAKSKCPPETAATTPAKRQRFRKVGDTATSAATQASKANEPPITPASAPSAAPSKGTLAAAAAQRRLDTEGTAEAAVTTDAAARG